jgi:Fe-S-cluster containining protein
MQIEKNVRAVERIYAQIDKAGKKFLDATKVQCPSGCARCCHGKNVSASPLEFLPFAYKLYLNGTLDDRYWDMKGLQQQRCFLVEGETLESNGKCSEYAHRGVVCRLFGNGASVLKTGRKSYSACTILKSQIADQEQFDLNLQKLAPVYSDYYMKLRAIDNQYGAMLFPINLAILKAMEIVYHSTRGKRKRSV